MKDRYESDFRFYREVMTHHSHPNNLHRCKTKIYEGIHVTIRTFRMDKLQNQVYKWRVSMEMVKITLKEKYKNSPIYCFSIVLNLKNIDKYMKDFEIWDFG